MAKRAATGMRRRRRYTEAEREAAFVRADDTPMGYGLAAVPRGTTGAVSVRQAAQMVAARRSP